MFNRVTQRWTRYELIVIDELAYVVMPETAAELLFQIIAGRAERAAVIVTANLPFSEWTTMFPNARRGRSLFFPNTKTPPGCGKSRSVEREENQKQVFLPSHRPWKSRTTGAIPTFPTAPPAAGISTSLTTNVGAKLGWRNHQGLVYPSEIAVHEVQGNVWVYFSNFFENPLVAPSRHCQQFKTETLPTFSILIGLLQPFAPSVGCSRDSQAAAGNDFTSTYT